jgi:hypothetical protein
MATCLDIITLAMKQCRILPAGGVPSAAETEDGMAALQSLYDEWRTGGMFGSLKDYYIASGATVEAREGYRYYLASGATLTDATNDYIPQCGDSYTECDYASGIGPTRQPRDMALYESVTSAGGQAAKLYDRTEWIDLLDLESTDIAPLSGRGQSGLAACLATSAGFADQFGAQPGPGTVTVARHFLTNIMSKSGSTQDIAGGCYY